MSTQPVAPTRPRAPYRDAEPPRAEPARGRASRVNFPCGPLYMPAACACCLAPPQGSAFQSIPYGAWTSFLHVDFEVPYCAACLTHHAAARRRRLLSGLLAASVGAIAPTVAVAFVPYAPRVALGATGVLAALAVLLALRAWFALRPLPLRLECARVDESVLPIAATAFDVDLEVVNPAYARRMQEEHARHARSDADGAGLVTPVPAPVPAWTRADDGGGRASPRRLRPVRVSRMVARSPLRAFWLTAPAAGLAAGFVALRANYARVYFDNPTASWLQFRVEGGPVVDVAPRGFGATWLLAGRGSVQVTRDGQPFDELTPTVTAGGAYVFAPGEGACYARLTERLLTEQPFTNVGGSGAQPRRWVEVPPVDHVLEPFPYHMTYRAGEAPQASSRFARVRCGTDTPDDE